MVRLCIFDLDGTLINSLQDLADAVNHALQKMGFPVHEVEKYKYFVGDGVAVLLRKAAPPGCGEETLQQLRVEFDAYYGAHGADKTYAYEGCGLLLARLQKMGIKTAVLSNKPDAFVGGLVNRFFPATPFFAAFGKREGYEKKPHPAALNELIRQCGAEKEECLYIGDSDVDVYTAHNAGIVCCGALWGFRGYEELQKAGADFFAEKPMDVLKAVCP